MKPLKTHHWNGWLVSKMQHPYSSKPSWVGELFDDSGALVRRHEKLSLKVLKQCIELVNNHRQP